MSLLLCSRILLGFLENLNFHDQVVLMSYPKQLSLFLLPTILTPSCLLKLSHCSQRSREIPDSLLRDNSSLQAWGQWWFLKGGRTGEQGQQPGRRTLFLSWDGAAPALFAPRGCPQVSALCRGLAAEELCTGKAFPWTRAAPDAWDREEKFCPPAAGEEPGEKLPRGAPREDRRNYREKK